MIELFEHPTLVDGLLVFVALEAVVLYAWHRRTGGGLAPRTILSVLLPGGHFNYIYNVDASTQFQDQVMAGLTPTVPARSWGWSNYNCDGQRYDDPPRLFGI